MEKKSFEELIVEGKNSLITKYGFSEEFNEPFTGNTIKESLNALKNEIPVASEEYVNYIEKSLMALCKPYEAHIDEMNYLELEAYVWEFLMSFDVERGIMLGQVPHLIFNHSNEFLIWEKLQFDKYEERMKQVNENQ